MGNVARRMPAATVAAVHQDAGWIPYEALTAQVITGSPSCNAVLAHHTTTPFRAAFQWVFCRDGADAVKVPPLPETEHDETQAS